MNGHRPRFQVAFHCGLGDRERSQPVPISDHRTHRAAQNIGEMIHFRAIGPRITVEEEILKRIGFRAGFAPGFDGGCKDIARAQPTFRAEIIDPLFLAVARAPAVADEAKNAARRAQDELCSVDVP